MFTIPLVTDAGTPFPARDLLLFCTFIVVLVTLVGQGLTFAPVVRALGLRDVFSLDFRVEADDTVHLIEFEVCPGLPCFDFRAYCRTQWKMSLAEAMAAAAANRLP